jgi:hypothetical protein
MYQIPLVSRHATSAILFEISALRAGNALKD